MDRNVRKAKELYEEVLEDADMRLEGFAMTCYGHVLMLGYGEGRDVSRALNLFQRCVDNDEVFGILGMALLLWKGDDSIETGILRSKHLFNNVLEHSKNWKSSTLDLGSLFQFVLESTDLDNIPIPSELYLATRRPAKHFANLFFGLVLLLDLTSHHEDISRGTSLFECFLDNEYGDNIIQFVRIVETKIQEYNVSRCALQIAYADIVRHPTNPSRDMIASTLKTVKISSMNEVLAGHNILSLARRRGILTDEDSKGSTDRAWLIHTNFYTPASMVTGAHRELLHFIFRDAQVKGIIHNAVQFAISTDLSSNMQLAIRQMNNTFQMMSRRFLQIEENISSTFDYVSKLSEHLSALSKDVSAVSKHVSTLSKDLNKLHDLFKLKNKGDGNAALASCLHSLIPIVGKSIAESAKIAVDFFVEFAIEDGLSVATSLTENQLSNVYSVDLSDFRTGLYIFSEKGALKDIDEPSRLAVQRGVDNSGFKTLSGLQQAFVQQIRNVQHEDEDGQNTVEADSLQKETSEKYQNLDLKVESISDGKESVVATKQDSQGSVDGLCVVVEGGTEQAPDERAGDM